MRAHLYLSSRELAISNEIPAGIEVFDKTYVADASIVGETWHVNASTSCVAIDLRVVTN